MRRLFFVMFSLIVLAGCGTSTRESARHQEYDGIINHSKPIAFGEDNLIHIFCGEESWKTLQPYIENSLGRELFLVYNEKYFELELANIADISSLSKFKNLVFFGDLESTDKVSLYMKQSLAPEFIQRVEQSGGDMFIAKNHWVRDQIVLYVLAQNPEQLLQISGLQANQMFSILLKRYTERLAYHAYLTKVIASNFFDAYPFKLKIPENYRLFSNDKVGRFLSFIYRARMQNREIPDKYISIYYENMETDKVDAAWLIARRQMIGEKYFEGDQIDEADLRIERYRFAGYEGWRIIGPWKNMKHMIGGSFQAHGFWHEASKKAYIVDNSVFFPAGNKLPTMLELFMVSSSLEIKPTQE
ncbi:MAG: DUF4837 family protein [Candidatus Cloacimonadaceae bacterium]|nr:DUF4837 family protein [Candidatus Cloacimonadaceae bacterium]